MNGKRALAGLLIVIGAIGMTLATQATGAYYGHDPRLGGADLSLLWPDAPRIYAPTAIFAWAWAAPLPWPFAFAVRFGGAVLSAILTLAGSGFLVRHRWTDASPAAGTFAADAWGTIKDAIKAGLVMGAGS